MFFLSFRHNPIKDLLSEKFVRNSDVYVYRSMTFLCTGIFGLSVLIFMRRKQEQPLICRWPSWKCKSGMNIILVDSIDM